MMGSAGLWLVTALLLAGCSGLPARTNVSVRPLCGSPNGPEVSPPAQPWDYTACYPDGGPLHHR
jgi:hypothetical protein